MAIKSSDMKTIIFTFAIFMNFHAFAQPSIQWQRTFGGGEADEGNCVLQTSDGGFIVAGFTRSLGGDVSNNNGSDDFWVVKTNATGALEWEKAYGGSSSEWASCIQQTTDGGYVIAGFTASFNGDVTGQHGDQDAWIVKIDSMGGIEWQRAYGGSKYEDASWIEQTSDGGYIFAGTTGSNDGDVPGVYGSWDIWVVKTSAIGDILWQKTLGGSNDDKAWAIKKTMDNGYILAGETQSFDGDVSSNNGNLDAWFIKLNHLGEIEWENTFGGSSADVGFDVNPTPDGGYIASCVAGSTNGDVTGQHGIFDCWIIKISSIGELQWQKTIGGSKNDRSYKIIPSNDGNFIAIGGTSSSNGDIIDNNGGPEILVLKISANGTLLWQKTLGGTMAEAGRSISPTTDNGFILTGYTWSTDGDLTGTTNKGLNDIWVVKLAPETVAAPELPNHPLALFPNPAAETISFTLPAGMHPTQVQVFNTTGQLVLQQTTISNNTLNIQTLENGLYQVMASDQMGQQYRATFCKIE